MQYVSTIINILFRLTEMRKVFDSLVQPGTKVYEQIHNASEDMDMWTGVIYSVRVHSSSIPFSDFDNFSLRTVETIFGVPTPTGYAT